MLSNFLKRLADWLDIPANRINFVVTIAFFLLTVIFVLFIVLVIQNQRKLVDLQQALTKAEVDTLEKERLRIAGDLHDSLGPLLSAVKLQMNSLDTQIPDDLVLIEKAGVHIDNMMTSIRTISNSLAPKLLARKGLAAAVEDLVCTTQAIFPIAIRYEVVEIPRLVNDNELHIYRILQEIIHNTVKHAQCKQLVIRLLTEKQRLLLFTSDDGKGFEPESQKELGNGLGLRNIETRTDILNGSMEVRSRPDEGTQYLFEFPLTPLLLNKALQDVK